MRNRHDCPKARRTTPFAAASAAPQRVNQPQQMEGSLVKRSPAPILLEGKSSANSRGRCTSPLQSWEQGPSHLKLSLKRWLILLYFASSSKTLQDVFSAACLQVCCICLPSPGAVKRTWTPPDGAHLFSLCCKSSFSLAMHSTNTRIILLIFMWYWMKRLKAYAKLTIFSWQFHTRILCQLLFNKQRY